jgi:hypothetical protein
MTTDFKNNHYSALLMFRSLRDGVYLSENLWEESIILIKAESKNDAQRLAENIGRQRNLTYEASDGVMLSWEFFKVERIFEIDLFLETGSELFSRHLRGTEAESLLRSFEY